MNLPFDRTPKLEIAGRAVGSGEPCFVIAEAGVNHNGELEMARRLVDAAADAHADAVKFQTFKAERLATTGAPKADYQRDASAPAESQLEMLRRLELSEAMHAELIARCRGRGILFLSSPFEDESAELLHRLQVPAFKVPSGELTNLPYLRSLAAKGRPMIVSTGMATLDEVDAAVEAVRSAGSPPLALLHCVSSYPARVEDANLRAMETLRERFRVPVGYSDHTVGVEVALASVALGACIVEKHFTLDRNLPGPDHRASLEPAELRDMLRGIRVVEAALGSGRKEPAASEREIAAVARKSVVAAVTIPAGSEISASQLQARRPGTGISPACLEQVVGRRARVAIPAGSLIAWEELE